MNTPIETIEKNYKVKLSFLDENNKEICSINSNTNFIQDLYAMHGSFVLREFYNSSVKNLKDALKPKPPEEALKGVASSILESIEKSKVEKPLEDSFITPDAEEWLKKVLDIKKTLKREPNHTRATYFDLLQDLNLDYEIIKNAKLYVSNAIFSYKGNAAICGTYRYDTLNDLKEFLKDKQYILYCVYQYITGGAPNPDPNPFQPFVEGKEPKIKFVFRGVILDE